MLPEFAHPLPCLSQSPDPGRTPAPSTGKVPDPAPRSSSHQQRCNPEQVTHTSPSPSAIPTAHWGSGSLAGAVANPAGCCQSRGAGLWCWDLQRQVWHCIGTHREGGSNAMRAWGESRAHTRLAQARSKGEMQHPQPVTASRSLPSITLMERWHQAEERPC